jgi:hypothetical protein
MADRDYLGGVTNTVVHTESDGTVTVEERQDCQSILDRNQHGRDHRFDAYSPSGDFQEVANIPMVPYLEECRKAGCQPFSREADLVMEKMLVSPQFAKFISAPTVRDPHIIIRGAR